MRSAQCLPGPKSLSQLPYQFTCTSTDLQHSLTVPHPPFTFRRLLSKLPSPASPSDGGDTAAEPKDWKTPSKAFHAAQPKAPQLRGNGQLPPPPPPRRARGGKGAGTGAPGTGGGGSSALPPHPLAAAAGSGSGTSPQVPLPFLRSPTGIFSFHYYFVHFFLSSTLPQDGSVSVTCKRRRPDTVPPLLRDACPPTP